MATSERGVPLNGDISSLGALGPGGGQIVSFVRKKALSQNPAIAILFERLYEKYAKKGSGNLF